MASDLSIISIVLGLIVALPNFFGVIKPAAFGAAARKFPRTTWIGYILIMISTVWFVWNVKQESLADFERLKPYLYALFVGVGVGTCIFIKDFLAVRGFAVLILLVAKLIVDNARYVQTDWRLVVVTWAYLMVMAGMWFTISPWRLRDLINWATASESRTRTLSAVRCAFGVLVMILGFTVYRTGTGF